MIFTDLPREELLEAIARGDNRQVGHRAVAAEAEPAAGWPGANSRMRQFMEKVRSAYRQLQRRPPTAVREPFRQQGAWHMHDEPAIEAASIRPMSVPRRSRQPRPADEERASLPGLNDPYKAAAFREQRGKPPRAGHGQGRLQPGQRLYRFCNTCISAWASSASRPTARCSASSSADLQPKLVTVHGRNLLRICDYISLRRMPWIRAGGSGFPGAAMACGHEPIITRIEVEDWKRPGAGGKAGGSAKAPCMRREEAPAGVRCGGQSSPCSGSSASISSPQSPQIRWASGFAQAFMLAYRAGVFGLAGGFLLAGGGFALACPVVVEDGGAGAPGRRCRPGRSVRLAR